MPLRRRVIIGGKAEVRGRRLPSKEKAIQVLMSYKVTLYLSILVDNAELDIFLNYIARHTLNETAY